MMTLLLSSPYIFSLIIVVDAANILACLPTPSISHQIAYREIWKQLSLRGHRVTLLTTDPMNDPKLINLTEIDMHLSYDIVKNISSLAETGGMWNFQKDTRPILKGIAEVQLAQEMIQDLITNKRYKFDLVLAECVFPEFLAFAEIYRCPKIVFSTMDAGVLIHNVVGNTIHPALYPDIIAPFYPPLTFWKRVKNTLYTYHVLNYIYRYTYSDKDETIRTFFNVTTTAYQLLTDVDLLFLNLNPVINGIRSVGPSSVFVGDLNRVGSYTPLAKDLQEYLDNAKEGFIYFSLGSNVKSKELKKDSLSSIMQALGDMPYKVLWKFEDDHLPGKPKNVKLVKWANQRAVLAHPNIKLFVTQGGLQSMEEGIYNEVPFVVIPFFADQDQNALLMKGKGIAEIVDRHPFIRKENLKSAMLEVLNNSSYRNAVRRLKQLALDTPMTGVDKAIWWIEYVIRNKGAKHLRNPAADLPLYQYYLIDVIGFLVAVAVIVLYLLLFSFKMIVKLLQGIVGKPVIDNKKIQ